MRYVMKLMPCNEEVGNLTLVYTYMPLQCAHGHIVGSTCLCDAGWATDPMQNALDPIYCNMQQVTNTQSNGTTTDNPGSSENPNSGVCALAAGIAKTLAYARSLPKSETLCCVRAHVVITQTLPCAHSCSIHPNSGVYALVAPLTSTIARSAGCMPPA